MTQKGMLRVAKIKGWKIVRTSRGTLDLSTGTVHYFFTFKECPSVQCQVARSRVDEFKSLAAACVKS